MIVYYMSPINAMGCNGGTAAYTSLKKIKSTIALCKRHDAYYNKVKIRRVAASMATLKELGLEITNVSYVRRT